MPLFDWDADPTRAQQAWHGFLIWGRWNDPLFDKLLPFVQQAFTRLETLGEQGSTFVTLLATVAAHSQRDPWTGGGWLFQFVQHASDRRRAEWADAFGRFLESLRSEGATDVWQRWLSRYWESRITGVPSLLGDAEREAMVAWVCALRDNLDAAIRHLVNAPPPILKAFTLHRIKQSRLADSHGPAIATLLRQLLPHVLEIRHDTGELFELVAETLEHGADRRDVQSIAAQMARLGDPAAEAVRRLSETVA